MSDELKALEESAKATQEVAKTSRELINAGKEFAGFIKAPFQTALGIWDDNLKYRRWVNQVKLVQEAKLIMEENRLTPTAKIPIKFAIPLLESASLEDNKYLQNLWVNLLINSSNENNDFTLERSYISVLEQLTSLEAQMLITIYSEKYDENNRYIIKTYMLPEKIEYTFEDSNAPLFTQDEVNDMYDNIDLDKKNSEPETATKEESVEPSLEIKLALSNLARLQCIKLAVTLGEEGYTFIHPTLFGAKLYEAVKDI